MTKPATDAEIELVRDNVRRGIGIADKFAPAVLARLDAERARAEKAERELEVGLDMMMDVRLELHIAEAKLAKAREQVGFALMCTPSVRDGEIIYDCGDPWQILRGILDDTGGGET
jgi:hypothetical protein